MKFVNFIVLEPYLSQGIPPVSKFTIDAQFCLQDTSTQSNKIAPALSNETALDGPTRHASSLPVLIRRPSILLADYQICCCNVRQFGKRDSLVRSRLQRNLCRFIAHGN